MAFEKEEQNIPKGGVIRVKIKKKKNVTVQDTPRRRLKLVACRMLIVE